MLPVANSLEHDRSCRLGPAIAWALVALCVAGCTSNFLNQNDKLRRDNLHYRDTIEALNRQLAGRDAYIKEIQQEKTPEVLRGPGAQGVEVPHLVTLEFDRFSGVLGPGAEGTTSDLRLYVKTLDQESRFIPVAGRATVQVVAIRVGQPPAVIAEHTFQPAEFDQDYRTGLTGTHYTLDIPLPKTLPPGVDNLTVKLALLDAATGATITQEGVFSVSSKSTAPAVE